MLVDIGAPNLTTHGSRNNAGVALAEAGCEVNEIMALLGHKTPAQAIAYTERAKRGKLAAQLEMSAIGGEFNRSLQHRL